MQVIGKGIFLGYHRGQNSEGKSYTIVKILDDDYVHNLFLNDNKLNLDEFKRFDEVEVALNLYNNNGKYNASLIGIGKK